MAEGLMPQGIQKYLEKRGQTGSENKDRQVAFGRLGWAGEKEYELRFSLPGSEENNLAKAEITRITQGLREAGALQVLDRSVVAIMKAIDPKKATPAETVDEFAIRADTIADEMRREMKLNGVKDEDVLEAGPWAVLRAGERAAAKLMKLQGDPRAGGVLGASESLGTDIGLSRGYDVPDWAAVLGGALVERAIDAIEDATSKPSTTDQAQEREFEPSWKGRSWEEIQQESEGVANLVNPDSNRVRDLREERGKFAECAERDGVVLLLRDKVNAMMNPTYWIEGDPQNPEDTGVRGKVLSYRCDAMEAQTIDALTDKGQEANFNVYRGFIESDRQNIARNLRKAYLGAKKVRQVDLGWTKQEEDELSRLNGEAVFLGWKEIPPAASAMAVANTEKMIEIVRRGTGTVAPVVVSGHNEALTDPDVMKDIGKRALIRALLRGVWGEGELLQVSQAKSLMTDAEKNRIDAQIILLRDLSAADPKKLESLLENNILNAGTIVELLSIPGEMGALASACKALGLDLTVKGLSYFDGSEKIDRDATFGQAFGDDPRIYKFMDGGVPVDYSSWIGKKFNDITKTEGGILEKLALRATALQMGHTDLDAGAEDLGVKEAYAMAQILIKHSHLADFVLTNRDHPWCTEAYPLMNFYEEVLDRAGKSKPLRHGSYIRKYPDEFPKVDEKTGNLPSSEMVRSLFPPNFLTPYFFERTVMKEPKDGKTLFDSVAVKKVPDVVDFRTKEPMKIQTFRNRAAASVMDWLIEPPTIVNELSVKEGNAFADNVAVAVATVANYLDLNGVVAGPSLPIPDIIPMPLGLDAQELIYRFTKVNLAGRIGMALDKDKIALYEDEAFFLGVGLEGATYNFGDRGGSISIVGADTINWINSFALKLKGRTDRSTLAQDELTLFESLKGDTLAQQCIKAAAQGDWDTAFRLKNEINTRWIWAKTAQPGLMTYGRYRDYRRVMYLKRLPNYKALIPKMKMNFSRNPRPNTGK